MSDPERDYCIEPECDRQTWGHGERCATHTKQFQRTGKCSPIAEKKDLNMRFIDACNDVAEADEDNDFERAKRRAIELGKQLGLMDLTPKEILQYAKKARAEQARRALADAKARGVRIGRPFKVVDPDLVRGVFEQMRSISRTAKALRLHRRIVRRALGGPKGRVSAHPPASPAA